MQNYQWSEELSVGIRLIDDQHKQLVLMLGELQEKLLLQMAERDIVHVLHRLQNYAKEHFELEEGLMFDIRDDVPNYAEHMEEHRDFISNVAELMMRFVQEGNKVAWELFIFLGDWLVNHIQQTDVVLGSCLRSHGKS